MANEKTALNLFMQHRAELVTYASKITDCPVHAEDVVQEAYLKFDEASKRSIFGSPVSYLFRIVKNLSIDSVRIRAREASVIGPFIDSERIADDASSPETILIHKSDFDFMMEALNELPEQTRIALIMHRVHGCKLKEIAKTLKISVSRAHRIICAGTAYCNKKLQNSRS